MAAGLKSIGARFTQLGSSVKNFGAGVATIGAGVAGLGAAVIGPIGAATMKFVEAGDALQKMAIRTGVGAQALSELQHAAEQSGTSIETVEGALRRAQRAITEANDGSQSMADAFARLGLNTRQLAGLSTDQQFQKIAAAIAAVPDPTIRAARAMEIFGRGGTALLPLITSDMAALRKEARDLGLTLSQEDADAAATLGDAMANVGKTIKGAFLQVGAAVAPVLTAAAGAIVNITSRVAIWVRENRGVVVTIGAIGAGLAAVGTVITGVGVAVVALGSAIGAVGTIATFLGGTVLGTLGGPMLAAIAGAIAGWTAIGAAIGYVLHQTGVLMPVLNFLGESFSRVFGVAMQSVGGVVRALSSGQWGKAAEIAWAGVKLAVFTGAQQVLKGIDGLWNNAGKITWNFFKALGTMVYNVFSSLPKIAWSALRGGAALADAISGALGNAFDGGGKLNLAGNLDGAVAGAQARLNQLTAQQRAPGSQAPRTPQAQQAQRQFAPRPIPQVPSVGGVVAAATRGPSAVTAAGSNGAELGQLVAVGQAQLIALRRLVALGGLT